MAQPEFPNATKGRPRFQPSASQRQTVEAMAGCGIPEVDISLVMGVAPKTLRKHFRTELDTGHIKANAKIAGNLYRIATGNGREAVTAAIFWLKTRSGWKEPVPERIYPLGKKEIQTNAWKNPDPSSDWGDDLIPGST